MTKKVAKRAVRIIEIPGDEFSKPEELQKFVQDAFSFPDYYGLNLDALYDCLSEISEKTKVVVSNSITEEENLGVYGERFLSVLEEAAQDNEYLELKITE